MRMSNDDVSSSTFQAYGKPRQLGKHTFAASPEGEAMSQLSNLQEDERTPKASALFSSRCAAGRFLLCSFLVYAVEFLLTAFPRLVFALFHLISHTDRRPCAQMRGRESVAGWWLSSECV